MDLKGLEAIIFDFDGVLTDNAVYVGQDGYEMVRCSRSDGLAFEALRSLPLKLFILSHEANPVVTARAAKLKVPAVQGSHNKLEDLESLAQREHFSLEHTMFVGNDVTDLGAIRRCGMSACPSDGHGKVLDAATFKLASRGGEGVVRELVEDVLGIDVEAAVS